jgi:sugar-specific transcriptional regulator TrmB
MYEELFRQIGLTDGETKVYLALLQLGESTIGAIVRESKVTKSKIYDILDRLIDKGFVGYVIRNGKKHFSTNNPNMILEYIDQKAEEIEKIKEEANKLILQLSARRATMRQEKQAEMYEGFRGVKAVREELISTMKRGDEFLVLGAPKIANEKWEAWFLDFHKRRTARGVEMRIIYNSDAREYGKIRKRMKFTKVRYLPNDLVSPNWIDIFNDSVMFVTILKEPIGFVIRDKTLAQSFRSYFSLMWSISKD